MPQSRRAAPASIRDIWIGPGFGILLGLATGTITGWRLAHEHLYFAHALTGLAWSAMLRLAERHAVYAVAVLAIVQLLALIVARAGDAGRRRTQCGALVTGLVLGAGLLVPVNQAPWFPGSRTLAGLLLNGLVVILPCALLLAAVRRAGPGALASWMVAPGVRRVAGVALVVGIAGLGTLRVAAWSGRGVPGAGAPNIILISIDTLRYDHMSVHGYARQTTPHLDAFAATAVRFSQATTPRPKTTPSVASMLTGLYPHSHGVRRLVDHLHPRNVTLAEVLRNAGYRTGAIVCNYVLNAEGTGLGEGFDFYHDTTPEYDGTQLDAAPATDIAIRWLHEQGDTPVFLWLHYMDPHGPYASPPPFDQAFVSESRGRRLAPLDAIPPVARLGDETDIDVYVDQYDGEILYTDHQVQRLLADLDARGLRDRTIVVVTADHGESLGDHDYYFEHGLYVYDDCARIPLMMRHPGGRAGIVVDAPVELIDLYPTLLDLAGLASPVAIDGTSL
ncbi:MAG: sulfatase, partial [Candidatus Eiseniibacteriota bacterium]